MDRLIRGGQAEDGSATLWRGGGNLRPPPPPDRVVPSNVPGVPSPSVFAISSPTKSRAGQGRADKQPLVVDSCGSQSSCPLDEGEPSAAARLLADAARDLDWRRGGSPLRAASAGFECLIIRVPRRLSSYNCTTSISGRLCRFRVPNRQCSKTTFYSCTTSISRSRNKDRPDHSQHSTAMSREARAAASLRRARKHSRKGGGGGAAAPARKWDAVCFVRRGRSSDLAAGAEREHNAPGSSRVRLHQNTRPRAERGRRRCCAPDAQEPPPSREQVHPRDDGRVASSSRPALPLEDEGHVLRDRASPLGAKDERKRISLPFSLSSIAGRHPSWGGDEFFYFATNARKGRGEEKREPPAPVAGRPGRERPPVASVRRAEGKHCPRSPGRQDTPSADFRTLARRRTKAGPLAIAPFLSEGASETKRSLSFALAGTNDAPRRSKPAESKLGSSLPGRLLLCHPRRSVTASAKRPRRRRAGPGASSRGGARRFDPHPPCFSSGGVGCRGAFQRAEGGESRVSRRCRTTPLIQHVALQLEKNQSLPVTLALLSGSQAGPRLPWKRRGDAASAQHSAKHRRLVPSWCERRRFRESPPRAVSGK
jgi:hypothetical protein